MASHRNLIGIYTVCQRTHEFPDRNGNTMLISVAMEMIDYNNNLEWFKFLWRLCVTLLFVLSRWFCCCWFIVLCTSHCLWEFCVCICFVKHYFVSILVLQSSWRGRESWLLCYYRLTDVLLLYMFCGSSSQCLGLVCSMWLWYFLIKLTCFLPYHTSKFHFNCLNDKWL